MERGEEEEGTGDGEDIAGWGTRLGPWRDIVMDAGVAKQACVFVGRFMEG